MQTASGDGESHIMRYSIDTYGSSFRKRMYFMSRSSWKVCSVRIYSSDVACRSETYSENVWSQDAEQLSAGGRSHLLHVAVGGDRKARAPAISPGACPFMGRRPQPASLRSARTLPARPSPSAADGNPCRRPRNSLSGDASNVCSFTPYSPYAHCQSVCFSLAGYD